MVNFITYDNKESLNENPDILDKYKCNASDLNEIKEVINETIIDTLYPINIIVPFYDSADHSNWLGLTWERIGTGKALVGYDSSDTDFNSIGKTGGEKTHTLSVNEIATHYHGEYIETKGSKKPYTLAEGSGSVVSGYYMSISGAAYTGPQVLTGPTGGGQAHNNLQPYEVVSFWKRVS